MVSLNPAITQRRARQLRHRTTDSEARLWLALKTRPEGLKWRRQHAIPPFIVDFYNAERRVAVEVDGGAHDAEASRDRDARRDATLGRLGVTVLRVRASDVGDRCEAVVDWITARTLARAALGPKADPHSPRVKPDRRALRREDPSGPSGHLPASGEGI